VRAGPTTAAAPDEAEEGPTPPKPAAAAREPGAAASPCAARKPRLRLTFAQALVLSVALHAGAAAPFVLAAVWPEADESSDTLVVEMSGLLSENQMEAKAAPPETEAPRPEQPAPAPQQAAAREAQAAQAPSEQLELSDDPSAAPPTAAAAQQSAQAATPPTAAPPQAQPVAPPPQRAQPTEEAQAAHSIAPDADDEEDALRRYGARLAKKVQSQLVYPDAAQASRAQGVTKVAFALRADGSVDPASLHVVASSGSPNLDAAALATIARGAPYPPPPKPTTIAFSLSFGKKR
jgi:protein TonB